MILASMHERLARALARRAGIRAFRFFRRDIKPGADVFAPTAIELRILREPDVLQHCGKPDLDLEPGRVRTAFARGDVCAAAFESGALVGYCWFAFAPLPHLDGVWVEFHEAGVWVYKSLVLPSHRGRGIAPALYRFTDRMCAERNRRFSIVCVETHNRPSIAAVLRSGYAPAGHAGYLLRGRSLWRWSMRATKRIALHFYLPA